MSFCFSVLSISIPKIAVDCTMYKNGTEIERILCLSLYLCTNFAIYTWFTFQKSKTNSYPSILLSTICLLPEIAADCTVDKKVDTGIDFHKKPKTIYIVFRDKEGTMGCLLH